MRRTHMNKMDADPASLPLVVQELVYAVDGERIIDSLSLQISTYGCTAIMGYNGAGKSVLLRLLHGLLTPTSGTIQWSGNLSAAQFTLRQAMVFQSPLLLRRSVQANLKYALSKRGFKGAVRADRIEATLQETNLIGLRQRHAQVLSGGERQRVALARALAVDPEILFLDEPTASLDPAGTVAIEKILRGANDSGRKLILVTHNVGQAARLARDVVFIHRGRVTEHTPIEQFLREPQSAEARAFVNGYLCD